VPGVLPEEPIRFLGNVSDLRWQVAIRRPEARRRARSHSLSGSSSVALPAARSARASAASLLSALCEAANWRVQCSSSRSSSSSHWAIRSCSSAGSVVSFAMAVSSALVIEHIIPIPGRRGRTTGCTGGRQSAVAEPARWRTGQTDQRAIAQEGCGRFATRSCRASDRSPPRSVRAGPKADSENSRATGTLLCRS